MFILGSLESTLAFSRKFVHENWENLSVFVKVRAKKSVALFYLDTVYNVLDLWFMTVKCAFVKNSTVQYSTTSVTVTVTCCL